MIREQKSKHLIMSKKRCIICNAPLKQTLVDKNPKATMDYCCFKLSKGVKFAYKYEIKEGVRIQTDKIRRDFRKEQLTNIRKYKSQ